MLDKLKAKKDSLVAKETALVSELEKVKNKIGIVDEMIAEESSPEATPVAERTIEFGTVKPRTSF